MRNTPNYNLPQYEGTDKFTKEVLNDAFTKVDTAINDLQETFNVNGSTSTLTTQEVINARNGKQNLKERIDEIDEQYNDIANNKLPAITGQLESIEQYKIITNNFLTNNNKNKGVTHIMAGMDSLTNGAGGTSWCDYFRDKAFAQLGCGGLGYIGFHNATIVQEGGTWSTTSSSTVQGTQYEQYSLDRKGVIVNIGGKVQINFRDKDYDNVKIIYLKQPNGGKFNVRWLNANATVTTIDTNNNTYELGYFDLKGNSSDVNGCFICENVADNTVVLLGAYLTSNKGGLVFSRLGMGGEQFKKHAQLNATFREKWLDILNPDYLLFNGGTNDEQTVLASEYEQLLEVYIRSFLNKSVKITLIMPNKMEKTVNLYTYAPILQTYAKNNKCSYVDHSEVLGTYENSYARGLQLDGCHPNRFGNELLGSFWLNRFGMSSIIESMPWNRTWETSTVTKQYFAKLSNFSNSINASAKTQIYNLGFLNAYTVGSLKLNIHGQEGSNALIKDVYVTFKNGTVVNQCTWVSLPTTTEKHKSKDSNITTLDYDVAFEVINNKLIVSITPNMIHSSLGSRNMYFNVTGEVSCPYVGTTGQLVYEN